MVTIWGLIEALPKLIALFQLLAGMARDAEQRGLGRKEAIADALTVAHRDIAAADAAAIQAEAAHAANPHDDGGFDADFQRKD